MPFFIVDNLTGFKAVGSGNLMPLDLVLPVAVGVGVLLGFGVASLWTECTGETSPTADASSSCCWFWFCGCGSTVMLFTDRFIMSSAWSTETEAETEAEVASSGIVLTPAKSDVEGTPCADCVDRGNEP